MHRSVLTIENRVFWLATVTSYTGSVYTDDNKCDSSPETCFQRGHNDFQPSHEGVSEVNERACEWSKRAKQA